MYKLCQLGRLHAFSHRIGSITQFTRGVFNVTGEWIDKLDRDVRVNIEKYWKDKLHDVDISASYQASIGNMDQ